VDEHDDEQLNNYEYDESGDLHNLYENISFYNS
jgi:hypothetical protein